MKKILLWVLTAGALAAGTLSSAAAQGGRGWPQWGRDARHHGMAPVAGQRLDRLLADIVYDPFAEQERAEQFGVLAAHFQVPLVDGDDVFMEWKTGTYISCDPPGWMTTEPCGVNSWNTQVWNERRLHWQDGRLVTKWSFASDWKPAPVPALNFLGPSEPVFHAILVAGHVYVPGAGGTLFKLDRTSGRVVGRINPFGTLDRNTFTAGSAVADRQGNLYYQAFRLARKDPWNTDIRGAWLIKVRPDGSASKVSFSTLATGAPAPTALCKTQFPDAALPWPPSPAAVPPVVPCGSQRPGVNGTPAIGLDGTVYVPSRAHRADRYSFLLAVNLDLTPRWAASLRGLLNDGCGTATLPPTGAPGGCKAGVPFGVDPATNEKPAGRVVDPGTNAPVVTPDGSILLATYTEYDSFRGEMFKFNPRGQLQGSYDFGLDVTPNIYSHDGTYSIILKENHYGFGTYCTDPVFCPASSNGPFYVTQLSPALIPEWKFASTTTESCHRNPDGTLSCVADHPDGFEWCINAAAVDKNGVVYANSEDGNLYAIAQGGVEKQRIFLQLALGAAYTPLSIGPDGKIYTQNAGHLFVVGN
jgi:outer membrane protein assembly factor BamB